MCNISTTDGFSPSTQLYYKQKPGQPPLLVQLTGFLKSYLIKFYQLLNRTLIIQPFLKLLSLDHNPVPIMQDPFRPVVILHHISHLLISNMEINCSFFNCQKISFIKCNAQILILSHYKVLSFPKDYASGKTWHNLFISGSFVKSGLSKFFVSGTIVVLAVQISAFSGISYAYNGQFRMCRGK